MNIKGIALGFPRAEPCSHGDLVSADSQSLRKRNFDWHAYLIARAEGLPLIAIGALIDKPLGGLLALSERGIEALEDLRGGRIGYSLAPLEPVLWETMLGSAGISVDEVELINVNEQRADMDAVEQAAGYAIGSPDYFSYVAGGIKQFFDDVLIAKNAGKQTGGKPCVLFLTHGGGGKAVDSLERLAGSQKLVQVAETLSCKGAPESQDPEPQRGNRT